MNEATSSATSANGEPVDSIPDRSRRGTYVAVLVVEVLVLVALWMLGRAFV